MFLHTSACIRLSVLLCRVTSLGAWTGSYSVLGRVSASVCSFASFEGSLSVWVLLLCRQPGRRQYDLADYWREYCYAVTAAFGDYIHSGGDRKGGGSNGRHRVVGPLPRPTP